MPNRKGDLRPTVFEVALAERTLIKGLSRMSDPFTEIETKMREQGIVCFSIRPERGGVRINYRKDHWKWIPGKKAKTLRDAMIANGLLDPEEPVDLEDLLG